MVKVTLTLLPNPSGETLSYYSKRGKGFWNTIYNYSMKPNILQVRNVIKSFFCIHEVISMIKTENSAAKLEITLKGITIEINPQKLIGQI